MFAFYLDDGLTTEPNSSGFSTHTNRFSFHSESSLERALGKLPSVTEDLTVPLAVIRLTGIKSRDPG